MEGFNIGIVEGFNVVVWRCVMGIWLSIELCMQDDPVVIHLCIVTGGLDTLVDTYSFIRSI